jgi:hypothetical protein
MAQAREVATCTRCRQSKRRCDKAKPVCGRCEFAKVKCTYEENRRHSPSDYTESERSYITPATTPPTPDSQHGKVKKRNRACLSCVRCHRLKIKCDQKQPCARCSRSGLQATCAYTHRPQLPEQAIQHPHIQPHTEIPFALTGEDPEFVVATWYLRKRGSTHYRAILNRVSFLHYITAVTWTVTCNQSQLCSC